MPTFGHFEAVDRLRASEEVWEYLAQLSADAMKVAGDDRDAYSKAMNFGAQCRELVHATKNVRTTIEAFGITFIRERMNDAT